MIWLGGKCDFCRFLGQNRAPLKWSNRDMAAGVRAVCLKIALCYCSFQTRAGTLNTRSMHLVTCFYPQNQEYPENRPNSSNL